MSSPERSVSPAPEPTSVTAEPELSLFERVSEPEPTNGSGNGSNGASGAVRVRRTPVVPMLVDAPTASTTTDARSDDGGPDTTELEFEDDPLLSELAEAPVVPIVPADEPDASQPEVYEPYAPDASQPEVYEPDSYAPDSYEPAGAMASAELFVEEDDTGYVTLADEAGYGDAYDDGDEDDEEELVEVVGKKDTRGKLKARKVRRVVRYVSPWSVLKVSLLFYACLWVIGTIASVILWRVAVETGGIANVEKFVARLFGEKSFTIDGREILRASTIAGVILVFAGTGFTVLMSLLFNVICDITGGIRFTVLELETTKRRLRKRAQAARDAGQA